MAHYYSILHPVEALVASTLEASAFGTYMATGAKQGSAEQLIFAELDPALAEQVDGFDWARAKAACDEPGEIKHSSYLGIYRILERLPLSCYLRLYLVTKDGRNLGVDPIPALPALTDGERTHLYQELCPVQSLAVSSLGLAGFMDLLLDPNGQFQLPALMVAPLRMPDEGSIRDDDNAQRQLSHLHWCTGLIDDEKPVKIVDRTAGKLLAYRRILGGISIGRGNERLHFPMPSKQDLTAGYASWGRSALII